MCPVNTGMMTRSLCVIKRFFHYYLCAQVGTYIVTVADGVLWACLSLSLLYVSEVTSFPCLDVDGSINRLPTETGGNDEGNDDVGRVDEVRRKNGDDRSGL